MCQPWAQSPRTSLVGELMNKMALRIFRELSLVIVSSIHLFVHSFIPRQTFPGDLLYSGRGEHSSEGDRPRSALGLNSCDYGGKQ